MSGNKRIGGLTAEEIADFYGKHFLPVFRLCMSFMKNEQDAADMTEETFLRWIETGRRPPEDKAEPWLIVTAGNLCRDRLRRRKAHPALELSEAALMTAPDQSQRNRELFEGVMSLPDKYKTAIFLFYYEDMTVEQIAAVTGQRKNTVRSQLTRARAMLRKYLGDELDE